MIAERSDSGFEIGKVVHKQRREKIVTRLKRGRILLCSSYNADPNEIPMSINFQVEKEGACDLSIFVYGAGPQHEGTK